MSLPKQTKDQQRPDAPEPLVRLCLKVGKLILDKSKWNPGETTHLEAPSSILRVGHSGGRLLCQLGTWR